MLNSRSPSIWRDFYESVKSDPPSACQLLRNDESRRTDREIDDFASPENVCVSGSTTEMCISRIHRRSTRVGRGCGMTCQDWVRASMISVSQ